MGMNNGIDGVLDFWISEVGEAGWYIQDDALDTQITARFKSTWERAHAGDLTDWMLTSRGMLAMLIVTDQFSRNMFRGSHLSFATDALALSVARLAITRGDDLTFDGAVRQFFYLPTMHSESLSQQEFAVRQFMLKMPQSDSNLLHARAHRDVIRTFGRFPYRNAALGRRSTAVELQYLRDGAYGATVRALQRTKSD